MARVFTNHYFSELVLEQTGPNRWRLREPLLYFGSDDTEVEVPAGFQTDLASVPRMVWGLYSKTGKLARPSVVHDWLYVSAPVRDEATRRAADRVFLQAMRDDGVRWPGRQIVYQAVRRFGGLVFYRNRSTKA